MKKVIYLLSFVFMGMLISCGNEEVKSEDESKSSDEIVSDIKKAVEEMQDAETDVDISDCDDFLDQYEMWMDDYLEILEGYMKNPMDASLSQKYMKSAQEAATWATKWGAFSVCAAKDEYVERFDKIHEKAEAKMKELGLD